MVEASQQWWHIAYVCFKPWRAVAVKVELVDKFAKPLGENNTDGELFVRPTFEKERCRVLPLQKMVSELDPNLAYDMGVYRLSADLRPMPVMRGHARIFSLGKDTPFWLGMLQEEQRSQKGRRCAQPDEATDANPPPALFGLLADEAEEPSDNGSQESAESEHDMTEALVQAAEGNNVDEAARRRSSGRSESVSSSASSASCEHAPLASMPQVQPSSHAEAKQNHTRCQPSYHSKLAWVQTDLGSCKEKLLLMGAGRPPAPITKKATQEHLAKRLSQQRPVRQKQLDRHFYR